MQENKKLIDSKVVYEFDCFRVDPINRLLLRAGEVVPLTSKVFDILLVFIENDGRLLEKEELMRQIWQNSFVEEGNLTRNVSTLRKALGEGAKAHPYIITVPGHGYKFVADVRVLPESPSVTVIAEQTISTTVIEEEISLPGVANAPRALSGTQEAAAAINQETKKTRTKMVLVAAACLVVMVLTALLIFRKEKTAILSKEAAGKSIAVLPLKPLNMENRDPVYELGIADSLILKLSGVKEIIVRPLSATRKYTNPEQDPLAAGREQQVDYVLAPSYQLAGGKIRVTAQLYNVRDGSVQGVFKCDEKCADIFAMQDVISEKVGQMLLTHFSREQSQRLAKHYTSNEEAYKLYLLGKYLAEKRDLADARKALESFEQAIKLDPNYALAYVGLAYAQSSIITFSNSSPREGFPKVKAAVTKALELDGNLAEAYTNLGFIQLAFDYDFSGAEKSYQRALELDSNSIEAHRSYGGLYLANMGHLDEAIAEIKIAIELDPNSLLSNRALGQTLYYAHRYDEAIAQLKRVVEMDASFLTSYDWLIQSCALKGDEAQAFEWFVKYRQQLGRKAEDLERLKAIYQRAGWKGILRERLTAMNNKARLGAKNYAWMAGIAAQLGAREEAFEYLNKALENREEYLATLKIEPMLDPLRADPRFDELVRRIGLK